MGVNLTVTDLTEQRHILNEYIKDENKHKIEEIKDYINNTDGMEHGYICFEELILSLQTYKKIRELLEWKKERVVIVDCGCSYGIQQILFYDFYKYIGIDKHPAIKDEWKILQDNASIFTGSTETVLDSVITKIKKDLERDNKREQDVKIVGISVLCHSYFKGQGLEKFKEVFDFMICI